MARKGNRIVIDKNISQDATGIEIRVMVNGIPDSQRFALGTPLAELQATRNRMKLALEAAIDKGQVATAKPGTMGADAKRYTKGHTVKNQDELERQIAKWVAALGATTPRRKVTADRVGGIVKGWATKNQPHIGAPYAPEYIAKLLRTLKHMFAFLDGGFHPFGQVSAPPVVKPEARNIPATIADAIIDGMRPSVTRARLRLMLALGITPAEIARLQSHHIDWVAGTVLILARQKGEGAAPRVLPFGLMDRAVAAVKEYAAYNVWGQEFAGLSNAFSEAKARAGYAARDFRPYDLRHTCGTELYRHFKSLDPVRQWLGHTSEKHTRRYTLGAANDQLVALARAFNDAERARAAAAEAARFTAA